MKWAEDVVFGHSGGLRDHLLSTHSALAVMYSGRMGINHDFTERGAGSFYEVDYDDCANPFRQVHRS